MREEEEKPTESYNYYTNTGCWEPRKYMTREMTARVPASAEWGSHPGQSGCMCVCVHMGRGGHSAVRTQTQSHLCFSLHMGSKINHENLRVFYTSDDSVFKPDLQEISIPPSFLLNSNEFFPKGIWSSQNNSRRCSRTKISSRPVPSQKIHTWFIRNRKIFPPSFTEAKKQKEAKQL